MVHRGFMPRMHKNALRGPQILPDGKTLVQRNMSQRAFVESVPVPPQHEK
jgi:hypothetical protein